MAASVLLLLICLQGPATFGQSISYVSPTPENNGQFGGSIAGAGDLNDDGIPDVVIGAPGERVGSSEGAGQAYVFSGKTGDVVYALRAPDPTVDAFFGTAVAEVGDVTGDGIPDLAVAETGPDRQGRVYMFDGREGTILRTHKSPAPASGGLFGRSLAAIGDVDGDGRPDLAVGAIGEGEDRVYVFSGGGGEHLYTVASPTKGHDHFGHVAALDDVDGDGVTDLLVGASTTTVGTRSSAGRAYVYSGRTGERVRRLTPPTPRGGHFAYATAAADVNGDAVSDAIVGEVGRADEAGYMYVFDGSSGRVLQTLRPPPPEADGYRGYSVVALGDVVGGDGPDVVLGTRVPATDSVESGQVYLYEVATGQRHRTITRPGLPGGARFGASVASTGTDGSGAQAVLVGAPGATVSDTTGAGRVDRFRLP